MADGLRNKQVVPLPLRANLDSMFTGIARLLSDSDPMRANIRPDVNARRSNVSLQRSFVNLLRLFVALQRLNVI